MKKIKLLSSIAALATTLTPVFMATACNKNSSGYTQFDMFIKEESVKEFFALCNVDRATFETRKIADYLHERVENLGLGDSWHEDQYRSKDEKHPAANSSGNCRFDIPASLGHENDPGVILQCHIDMVVEPTGHTGGIEPVIDGNTIHTKNYATSLGADNGIGIGFVLALANHRDKFVHGPIRCLMTADEEEGESGASWLSKDTGLFTNSAGDKIYNNVINVDSEKENQITISCADTNTFKFTIYIDGEEGENPQVVKDFYPHVYSIRIYDLLGGHSANNINDNRLNGISVMSDILWSINNYKEPETNGFRLISIVSANSDNRIANDVTAIFTSNKELDLLETYYINPIYYNYKILYPNEIKMKKDFRELTPAEKSKLTFVFDDATTNHIVQMLFSLPFGPYEWIDPATMKEVATSNNVGPLNFDANATPDEITKQFKCTFTSLIRSCIKNHSIRIGEYITGLVHEHFGLSTAIENDQTPSWTYEGETKLYNAIKSGYADVGLELKTRNAHSWLECGYIKQANTDAHIVSIGPRIEEPHSVRETLYLDSFNQVIHSIIKVLENPSQLKE